MNNKIITSEGNVQFQYPDGGIVNVHPSLIYTVFNEDTVSFMLIPLPKSSGLAIMASKAKDLELNGTIYSIDDLPNAIAEAFSDAGAQARAEIVDELPTTGKTNTIYLVPKEEGEGYDEYIYLKDEQRWELIGDTSIEIKEYVKKADFSAYTASTQEVIDFLSGAVDDNASDIQFISGAVDTEISNREAADTVISGAVDTLSTNLANEVQRAISAETELNSNLETEVSARTEADSVLSSAIDTVVSNLASEVSRAESAEAELSNKIDAISGDAEDIQAELDVVSASLEAEVSARTEADDAFDARLDEDEKVIGESLNDLNTRMTANEAAEAELSDKIDAVSGNAITSGEVETMIDAAVSGKADADNVYSKSEVYTKAEVDEAIDDIDLSNYYTKSETSGATEIQNALDGKANSGDVKTFVAGRGISIATGATADTVSFNLPISAGTGNNSIVENYTNNKATKSNSHAEGYQTEANGSSSHAEGTNTKTSGNSAHAEGYETKAIGDFSHSEGRFTTANGYASHTEGFSTQTSGNYEHASGYCNRTYHYPNSSFGNSENTLFTVGNSEVKNVHTDYEKHNAFEVRENGDIYIADTNASGEFYEKPMIKLQDALGQGGISSGDFETYSGSVESRLSEDEEVTAAGLNALYDAVSGKQDTLVSSINIKTINNESILGSGNIDIQGGGKAIEAGRGISITTGETADTVSFSLPISAGTGSYSIAEGYKTIASFYYSHAEGNSTKSKGEASHAEGLGSEATGETAHAEGYYTHAWGNHSHAEGYDTIAKNKAEHASGRYNVSNIANTTWGDSGNTLFSVGNGTADDARHNAFEIRQNGDIYLTKDGQDVKLQDQLGGGGTVDQTIISGSTNAVAGGAVYNKIDEVEQVTAAGLNTLNDKFGGLKLVKLSQAAYDSLATKDQSTLYVIVD